MISVIARSLLPQHHYGMAMDILSGDGARALMLAAQEPDPTSLAAATRLRKEFPAELAAAALTQVMLRRRAKAKTPLAGEMLWTAQGLEQATRWPVAVWRAEQFRAAGVTDVWDLGCGLGVDAMAMVQVGLRLTAVEADPATAAFATANLNLVGGGSVRVGLAEEAVVPDGAGVFLDPARRTARGRTWDVADFSPPWQLVESYLTSSHPCAVKLGPGLPKPLIPLGMGAAWVSVAGDAVEAMVSNLGEPGPRAVLFPQGATHPAVLTAGADPLEVGPVGAYIQEPDNAVVRAGLVAEASPGAWLLAPGVAYTSSDHPIAGPFTTNYRVLEALDYDLSTLKRWVKQHSVGRLEIKRRAIDIDPAVLRKQVKPKGEAAATWILARTSQGARAFVVERTEPQR